MYKILLALIIAVAASFGSQSLAGTYQIPPSEDTWTYAYAPDANYGSTTILELVKYLVEIFCGP